MRRVFLAIAILWAALAGVRADESDVLAGQTVISGQIDAFRSGDSVDIYASSGELDFDPSTEETQSPLALKRIVTGDTSSGWTFETFDTVEPETP